MGVCGLYLGQRELGHLTWEQRGQRLLVRASCPCEIGLIYRLVLQTDQGLHRLGVMLPENELFILRREIPAGEVPQRAFIDRTLPEEVHLPGLPLAFSAFSSSEKTPELLSAYWLDTQYLMFRLGFGDKNDFASFFCLVTVIEYDGRQYGVFCKERGRYLPMISPETDRLRSKDVIW